MPVRAMAELDAITLHIPKVETHLNIIDANNLELKKIINNGLKHS
jgi:hypothetical protein